MPEALYHTYGGGRAHVLAWYRYARGFAVAHKAWSAVIALALLGGGWYAWGAATSTAGQASYELGTVARGTIVSSVTGSGQVAANQELSLSAKVSGTIVHVGVTPGQRVAAGTLIAEVDPTDALKAVRDAEASLASAELSYEKQQQSTGDNPGSAKEPARNDLVSTYLSLPSVVNDLKDIASRIGSNTFGSWEIGSTAGDALRQQAREDSDAAQAAYESAARAYAAMALASADAAALQGALADATHAVTFAQAAVKSANSYLSWYRRFSTTANIPLPDSLVPDLSTLATDAGKLASLASSLSSDQSALTNEPLDLQSTALALQKARNALADAQATLAEYYIRAPFAGTIGSVAVHQYDQASGVLATLITPAQVADLSVNEVDAAKITVGQKATLTFDAIPDLSLTGTVATVNPVGTVSQGVVSYDVEIKLDTQDSRIKTGMTVNATIQSAVHQDVLYVPASAVKTQGGQYYVLAFDPPLATTTPTTGAGGVVSAVPPTAIPVTIGISDDLNTEILSGLSEGEQIVVRSTSAAAAAASTGTTRTSGGTRGFGGGGLRIGG